MTVKNREFGDCSSYGQVSLQIQVPPVLSSLTVSLWRGRRRGLPRKMIPSSLNVWHMPSCHEIGQHSEMSWFGHRWGRIYQTVQPLLSAVPCGNSLRKVKSHFPLRWQGIGQIKAKRPKTGSSCLITLIATTGFRELNMVGLLHWVDFPQNLTEPLMTRISLGCLHSTCPAAWHLCKARVEFCLPWNQFKSISLFS